MPNAFSLQSIAQYKKPCGRKKSSGLCLPNAARADVVALSNEVVSIARNMGGASPRSVDVPCSRSARRKYWGYI